MSEIKIGDIVKIDADGDDEMNFSGIGEVIEADLGDGWAMVRPAVAITPEWDRPWWFEVHRISPVPPPGNSTDPTLKPTNPKDAVGSDKLPLHLWPETATLMGTLGLLDGMLKYGRNNWRETGVRATIYIDALKRHINAYAEGEDLDPDSGMPHLAHIGACWAILVDAGAAGKLTDDRNYPGGYRALVEELTPHVKQLKAKHAGKDPKHYTIADA